MTVPALAQERDPKRALAVITSVLAEVDGHPEAGFLRPADLRQVAGDVLGRWLSERDNYPGALPEFVPDYVLAMEAGAKPGKLAAAWREYLQNLS